MKINKNISRFILGIFSMLVVISSCKKDAEPGGKASDNPKADNITPGAAPANAVLTLKGTGLGQIRSIVFDSGNVAASFNVNFNTDDAVIFRIPVDAIPAKQNIVFTNASGKTFSVPFTVLGLPAVIDVSNYNYDATTPITVTGKNFADVSEVLTTNGNHPVTIVSKTATSLVLSFSTTDTISRTALVITNPAGSIVTTQEFVNVDKAFKIFTDDYATGYQDASWGDPGIVSSTVFKSGTKSVGKKYAAGNWHQFGFGWTNINKLNDYTYLSFWIKGASVDYPLWISSSASVGGFASFNDNSKIMVPANVWTYFKIPLSQLDLWNTSSAFNQLGWRIQGPNGQDETFYLDDVIFVK